MKNWTEGNKLQLVLMIWQAKWQVLWMLEMIGIPGESSLHPEHQREMGNGFQEETRWTVINIKKEKKKDVCKQKISKDNTCSTAIAY